MIRSTRNNKSVVDMPQK